MSKQTWIVVADDMSQASVANVALRAGLPVKALVFGSRDRAESVAAYGVEQVLWFDTADTLAEAFAAAVAEMAAAEQPAAILCADEATARTITGIAAARLGAAATSQIVSVSLGDAATVDYLVAEGNSLETLEFAGPVAGSIADGCPEADPGAAAPIEAAALAADGSMKVLATNVAADSAASLVAAEKVVSCGLGIGVKDNLQLVYDLAGALGAEVACSLPLCDNYHWFEHSSVVGTSTQKISPRFYLACGVSGVPQHMLGVRGAKTIAAVNIDPEAPIFKESAYGIIGDAKEVLPALTKAIQSL